VGRVRRLRDLVCAGALVLLTCCVPVGGNITPPPTATPLVSATMVSTNWSNSCAVRGDGKVFCWGFNYKEVAVEVGVAGATDVSVGNGFACARLASGGVRCWGSNSIGELGNGTTTDVGSTPTSTSGITSATSLSVGYLHACALLADGTIHCWGQNFYGQLGDGSNADGDVPTTVANIANATSVSAGQYETCAGLADGTVRCWGQNTYGQLGDGTMTASAVPVAVSGLTGAVGVCTSADHSCAVLQDGTVQCWGANAFGENGNGAATGSSVPVAVAGIADATAVACGLSHTCALSNDGSVWCWGANGGGPGDSFGALGNPTATLDCTWDPNPPLPPGDPVQTITGETSCAPTPVQVQGITNAVAIAAGNYDTCAVLTDGSVRCWGWGQDGQLGDGSTTNSVASVPVLAY